jgi:hypothetical protein
VAHAKLSVHVADALTAGASLASGAAGAMLTGSASLAAGAIPAPSWTGIALPAAASRFSRIRFVRRTFSRADNWAASQRSASRNSLSTIMPAARFERETRETSDSSTKKL